MIVEVIGFSLLVHAVYSSYEWHSMHQALSMRSLTLPTDVKLELWLALLIVLLNTVYKQSRKLEPVYIQDLNSQQTKEGRNKDFMLEKRPNFQDIKARREAYLEWQKSGN